MLSAFCCLSLYWPYMIVVTAFVFAKDHAIV